MEKTQAQAKGTSLPISPKVAIMVCAHLRGKTLSRAKNILKAVIVQHESIPFTRFTNGVGHRKGKVGPGRFPLKASEHILTLLKSAEANAQDLGLDTENLVVKDIRANRASAPMRQGRQSRRVFKRAHVYVTLTEAAAPKKTAKKAVSKTASKQEAPKTAAKEAPKKTPVKTTKQEEEQ